MHDNFKDLEFFANFRILANKPPIRALTADTIRLTNITRKHRRAFGP